MRNSLLAIATVFGCVSAASAQLYGLDSSTPGTIYSVNQSTGAATSIATVSGAVLTSLTDIEFLNGVAYASDVLQSGGWTFGSLNINTGVYTAINNQGGSANWHALAAHTAANVLYTVDQNNNNNFLSITPSGTITTIGNTGIAMVGMTYDDNAGVLYANDFGMNLYTINTSNGAATLVGNLGVSGASSDLAYDEATNTLYFNSQNGNLYTVNTGTGLATLVGANGVNTIDGLGWNAPVPEPASMAALGLGVVALLRRRKK